MTRSFAVKLWIPALLVAVVFVENPFALESDVVATSARQLTAPQNIRAQLLPHQYTTIAAEIGAKINHLPVQESVAFKGGQVLVSFDCGIQEAMLRRAQAEKTSAISLYTANQRLVVLNSIGLVELEQSRAAVDKFAAEVGAQQVALSKCRITAPFDGRVAEQRVREQQFVQPGEALLDIIDDSVLELGFLVPSRWLAWIKIGQLFQVYIDETERNYPAKFIRIGARVDPVSQSVKVVAVIDGHFTELISGMSGRVLISPPENK